MNKEMVLEFRFSESQKDDAKNFDQNLQDICRTSIDYQHGNVDVTIRQSRKQYIAMITIYLDDCDQPQRTRRFIEDIFELADKYR